jgi:hypothetical protein
MYLLVQAQLTKMPESEQPLPKDERVLDADSSNAVMHEEKQEEENTPTVSGRNTPALVDGDRVIAPAITSPGGSIRRKSGASPHQRNGKGEPKKVVHGAGAAWGGSPGRSRTTSQG